MNFKIAFFIYILCMVTVLMFAVIDIVEYGLNRKLYVVILLIVLASAGVRKLKTADEKRNR